MDQNARQDQNQFPALIAHTGTAGTAETVRLVADADGQLKTTASVSAPGTQRVRAAATADPAEWVTARLTDGTSYYNASGGAGGGSTVITVGTITAGTITNLLKAEDAGHTTGDLGLLPLAVRVDGGTSLVGTDLDYAPFQVDGNGALRVSGTVATGAGTQAVRIIDGTTTLVSTVTTLSSLSAGTVSMLHAGTVDTVGTVTGVGVVTNLTSGSVRMTVGTLTVMPNVPGGTLGLVTSVTEVANLAKGTITRVEGGTVGLISSVADVANLAKGTVTRVEGGSIAVIAGTMIMTTGTINTGTINAGTINAGTVRVDGRTTQNILTYGTQFAATAAAYGTLVGSAAVGAGTSTWVQTYSLDNPYGTILTMLGFGTVLNGTSVLWKGVLGTQTVGGVTMPYAKPVNAGMTNQDLVIHLGAAGTVDVTVSYFISA